MNDNTIDPPWLLLVPQFPAKPGYLRIKAWRRLQTIGAIPLKNAVYALPLRGDTRTRFEELQHEIAAGGGEALMLEARLVGGMSNPELRGLFDAARDADYEELAQKALILLKDGEVSAGQMMRLRARRDEIAAIDFFDAHGRQAADALLAQLDQRLQRHPDVSRSEPSPLLGSADLKGRVWVTRSGVHVDRIASAWLIRRFIDPEATFKFVDGKTYAPESSELRFDMVGAEFTHEDDRCTFETLMLRTDLTGDPALRTIAEIVHDLDIADNKFGCFETAGIGALIAGICTATDDDEERIARGSSMLDGLHAHFSKRR